ACRVVICNQTAAQFYFGNENPIGKKVRFIANYPTHDLIYEIIGVVRDAKHDSIREQPSRFIYLPVPQAVEPIHQLTLAVRTTGGATAFAGLVRQAVQSIRPMVLAGNVSTVD